MRMMAFLQSLMEAPPGKPRKMRERTAKRLTHGVSKGVESAHPAGKHASCLGSHVYSCYDVTSRLVRHADRDRSRCGAAEPPTLMHIRRPSCRTPHRLVGEGPTRGISSAFGGGRGDRSA